HWAGHRSGAAALRVRSIPAGRQLEHADAGGPRHRADARQESHRAARRDRRGRERRPRPRRHLPHPAAAALDGHRTHTREATRAMSHVVRTMCPMNCHPTLCGMLVEIDGGRVVGVRGDPDNPDSQGFLCVRGQASREILDNPLRVLHPLIRVARGRDEWREATWDEALDLIVARMRAVGPAAVGAWSGHGLFANNYGTRVASHLLRRFTNLYGAQWWSPTMICWGLGAYGLGLTGIVETNTKEDMAAHAGMIVLWGANLASQPNTGRHLAAARRRG